MAKNTTVGKRGGGVVVKIIKDSIKNNYAFMDLYKQIKYLYAKNCISDVDLIKREFKRRLKREVELNEPIKFNDKLQWLKLNWYDPKAIICADKYRVREFVEDRIGKEYLNEIYEVYDSVDRINLNMLPESFVLKGTHGSGFNIICTNKNNIDWNFEYKKMKKWLKRNYYWQNREWVYKNIEPRIICEKYLEEAEHGELRDYKFFCFDGEPRLIQVDFNRFTNHERNIYDLTWTLLDVEIQYPNNKKIIIDKPSRLSEIVKLSKELSKGFPHVRVDFYQVKDVIYFGELTFFMEVGWKDLSPRNSKKLWEIG